MPSLAAIFKKARFKMAASGLFSPSHEIQERLQKEGWQFETHMVSSNGAPLILGNASYTVVKTPEGNYADSCEEDSKRYKAAVRKTAKDVYYPS